MKVIDADTLMKDICNSIDKMTEAGDLVDVEWLWTKLINAIKHAPTIEPERKKGKWKKLSGRWFHNDVQCSECGNTLDMNGVNAGRGDANFCPNCGADMR